MNGQNKKKAKFIFKLMNNFIVKVLWGNIKTWCFLCFNVSLVCLKCDGLDRQWDWSHAASACAKAGKFLYRHLVHEAQARWRSVRISFVCVMQDAGGDEVQNSKYNFCAAHYKTSTVNRTIWRAHTCQRLHTGDRDWRDTCKNVNFLLIVTQENNNLQPCA